ncbi:MAG: DnaJ domain-containing protein [bacterium]|nr:DnaJ domain-containing protein [bacterium]
MTAQNTLEQHGQLSAHPFAELLVEIVHAKFNGSLRINSGSQKSVIYFRRGQIVYAASNSKDLRLFNLLLRKNLIDTKVISRHPHFANDIEFAASLAAGRIVSKEAIDECFTSQMTDIVVDILTWAGGDWIFSPLVRARDGLAYSIDVYQILIDYARCTPAEQIFRRFRSVEESFSIVPERRLSVHLQPHESFVLARFEGQSLTIKELKKQCAMPEGGIFQALYVLWLGGLLVRRDWNSAFSATKIGEILTARVAKVKEAWETDTVPVQPLPVDQPTKEKIPEPEAERLPQIQLSLAQYLTQIEKAETHYDALGVSTDAESTIIKHHYFSLAKMFHPDRHHRESEEMLKRIQTAFTVLAHAHEILKTPQSRDMYNSKMYKEIEAREKRRAAGQPDLGPADKKGEHGLENFEEGLSMIAEEEYEAASAYLARAVHYSPQNALYHAYFGMALSKADDKYRHKAEGELQTAAKLDPKNPKIRMMLVDFLIANKMAKRAEGELKRFLELVPNNKEAMSALAKLSA